jgi:zinc/manganese transport system substrate-binding protein
MHGFVGVDMKRWIYLLLMSLLLASLVLTSCQSQDNPAQGKKSIVVTYSILGAVVRDLVGDKANVTVSIPNGLDPHEWEPSARDIEALNKADLVIQNGLGLEGGMLKALQEAQSKGVKFFTASDHVTIRHVGEGEGIPSGDPDQAMGAEDPHLWTDPIALKSLVIALSPVLKNNLNLDVSSQASDLENRLESLNKQITDKVAVIPQENRKLVTGHESMGYFAQRYGFRLVGAIIPSISTQAGVSAGDLAELKTLIEENQVRAIFTELGTSPVVAKAIGDETGVKVIELTTHQVPGDGSYFTFLADMADTIINGLK